ncbi:hypothetical protein [Nonomuraea typhae]|uniref:hypothetical protein n=1 Tax=Nonomuraea typhae TaxID=2603600 RepID=UPI0012F90D02|nr:hypothetical protein [Nonomuraea typhae]
MHLRPDLIIRCGNAFAGLCAPYIVLGATTVFADDLIVPDPLALALIAMAALAALCLAVRGYRMAIICTPATVTVRGWLRNRTITIEDVADVGDLLEGRLLRLDASGRPRTTPVIAFVTIVTALSRTQAHHLQAQQHLQDWVARHQSHAAGRRNAAALARRPVRSRLLWLGGTFDDVVGWLIIATTVTSTVFLTLALPPEIRAAQGIGLSGTFTAAELTCYGTTCRWDGTFRSHDGAVSKSEAWLYGTDAEHLQAGDQVDALDSGDPRKIFTPGTHQLLSLTFAAITTVALGWHGLRRITSARRERLTILARTGRKPSGRAGSRRR